jgi:hypothetical protein
MRGRMAFAELCNRAEMVLQRVYPVMEGIQRLELQLQKFLPRLPLSSAGIDVG